MTADTLPIDSQTLSLPTPEDATLGTPAHEDEPMKWTEDAMLRVLWRHFLSQSWAAVPQVTVSEKDMDPEAARLSAWDARDMERAERTDRRIDLLAVRKPRRADLWPFESLAIEVKVTRADFLNDVRDPTKQAPWRRAATRHCYAVPAGLVTKDEVPEGSGLLYVKGGVGGWGSAEWAKRAPYPPKHNPDLPPRVWIALLWRIAALEGHTRGWRTGPDAAGSPQELRAALAVAHKAAEKAEKARVRAEDNASAWKAAYAMATADGHPCEWCGKPVKPVRPTGGWFKTWRHVDAADDDPCRLAETAELEHRARVQYDETDPAVRDKDVRREQTYGFDPVLETEPWRVYLPRTYHRGRPVSLSGPRPSGDLPEGVTR